MDHRALERTLSKTRLEGRNHFHRTAENEFGGTDVPRFIGIGRVPPPLLVERQRRELSGVSFALGEQKAFRSSCCMRRLP